MAPGDEEGHPHGRAGDGAGGPQQREDPAPTIEPTPMNAACITVICFFGTVVDMASLPPAPSRALTSSGLARRLPPLPGRRNPSLQPGPGGRTSWIRQRPSTGTRTS